MRMQLGCLKCDLYQDVEDSGIITLVEEWESQADLTLRLRSGDYGAFLSAVELSREQQEIHFDTVIRREGLEVIA